MSEYDEVDEQFEEEEFEGFQFEDDTPQIDIPVEDMTSEQLGIWLESEPFINRLGVYLGICSGHIANIAIITKYCFIILYYKFMNSSFYRFIHIGTMIVGASLYWLTMFGQEDVQVLDGEDEHIIFHLPSV